MKTPLTIALLTLALNACGGGADEPEPGPAEPAIPDSLIVATAPAGAVDVLSLRESTAGAKVVVQGRVMDFIDDLAVFTLADLSFESCAENPDDVCETPWDYCCVEPDVLAQGTVTVEYADGDEIASATMRGVHGLDHLDQVVLSGVLNRDDAGNLSVRVASMHIAE